MADLDDAPTRQAKVDLAPDRIMPPLNEEAFRDAADPQALIARWSAAHPLGRPGQPEAVAEAVLLLASNRASFVTGEVVRVDGGLTIKGD